MQCKMLQPLLDFGRAGGAGGPHCLVDPVHGLLGQPPGYGGYFATFQSNSSVILSYIICKCIEDPHLIIASFNCIKHPSALGRG